MIISYHGGCDAFTPHALKNKKNQRVGIDCVTPPINRIEEDLLFIIGHFQYPNNNNIWPRTITTKTTEGRQIIVYNENEALARFKQANYLDCKIAAYRSFTEWKGINRQPRNLVFIDLDLDKFKSRVELYKFLSIILDKINDKLGTSVCPTVLWSGHGYHIYLPIDAFVLEEESQFAKFEQPSRRFIQFAEQYLSNKKSDPCHSFTMSMKNCMLRVPGSFNSKFDCKVEVKIIQRWNGVRPSIKPLLFDFYLYLQDLRLKKLRQKHNHPPREFCRYMRKK